MMPVYDFLFYVSLRAFVWFGVILFLSQLIRGVREK